MEKQHGQTAEARPGKSPAEDGFCTVAEAAGFLRVSRAKLYQMMDSQQLMYAKFGRCRRIPRRALREYAERCLIAG
jgi:excisionase family DNA binding protein